MTRLRRIFADRSTRRTAIAGVAVGLALAAALIAWMRLRPKPFAFEDETCRRTYTAFYSSPKIDVKVVFGYKDARPARFVADRYERAIFVQRLTQKCRDSSLACGFSRAPADADLFLRKITGPDGKEREVWLRVIQSSTGPDDEENRRDPFQKWRTRYANLAFFQSLSSSDVVFYNGHSRGGGGPDFEPPRLEKGGEVEFAWYREHEPGFAPVVATFEAAPSRLKLLGFFSCASTKHFLDRMRSVKPDLGMITSPKLIYFSDAMESSLEALSAILSMRCEGAFRHTLAGRALRAGGAQVSGFFDGETPSAPNVE
jgi:hypothetical protein